MSGLTDLSTHPDESDRSTGIATDAVSSAEAELAGVDTNAPRRWLYAEIQDVPFVEGVIVRAIVCRIGIAIWQWSVVAMDGDRGELISIGTMPDKVSARRAAASEVGKCFSSPFS